MTPLSDAALSRLREVADWPDLGEGRYEPLEAIGQGGMGTVWLAHDRHLDREVAIKVVRTPEVPDALAGRLDREARILARLEHPGIVPVHDLGRLADGRSYYVMKRVRGRRLDEWLTDGPGRRERLGVLLRVADAVAFAHANGVVHRDLKPANIMIGEFGEVLVLDWGVAKLLRAPDERPPAAAPSQGPDTADGTVVGTRGFMAPEQEAGQVDLVDERADVYALGALLHVVADPLPAPLASIARRAMAARREDRYPQVPAVVQEINRWLDGLKPDAHRETVVEQALRLVRKYRTPLVLVLAYLLMRVLMLVFGGA